MASAVHTVQILDPQSGTDFYDRVIVAQRIAVPYTATTGTAYPITFAEGLPSAYSVFITPSTDILKPAGVTLKTSTGFTVTLPGAITVAGVMDILVFAS